MTDQKRVNPFDKFRRANQLSPIKKGAGVPTFQDEGRKITQQGGKFQDSSTPCEVSIVAMQDRLNNVETLPIAAKTPLDQLRNAHARFGSSGSGRVSNKKGSDSLTHPDARRAAKFFRPQAITSDFENIIREDYLARGKDLLWYISAYYGIQEEEITVELSQLCGKDNKSLVLAVNGYEYAAQHVRVMCDDRFVSEIVFFENPSLAKYFQANGIADDVLERSTYADEISKLTSGVSPGKTTNR